MTTPNISHDSLIQEINKLVDHRLSKPSMLQLMRESRLKLGYVLDRLETFEPAPNGFVELHAQAETIACEIDDLVLSAQQFICH